MSRWSACLTLLVALVVPDSVRGNDRALTGNPATERVFFAFDDQNLAFRHNVKLTLVSPDKHPANPVVRSGPKGSPDYGHAILYGTVIYDPAAAGGGKFRMWYLGMLQRELAAGQAPGWYRPMCYAESEDGIAWTKPALGLVEHNGNKNNNICLVESEVPALALVNDFLSVLYEPNDPDPARRYKCAYIAHPEYADIKGGMSTVGIKERRVGAIICATSSDGLRWKVVGDRPANATGERFEVSSLYRFGDFYYAAGQIASPWANLVDGRSAGRFMRTYRSPDFMHWSQRTALSMVLPDQMILPQPSVEDMLMGFARQMHMGVAVWNRGNVLVGIPGIWQGNAKQRPKGAKIHEGLRIDLGLAISNDGVHFREPIPGFKLLEHGNISEWDAIALLQGHAFVNRGEMTYLWYSHWDCEEKFRNQEIGLATLRRDGFGYLSRMDEGDAGSVITSPITTADGARLSVNVSGVTAQTPLVVELYDTLDRPLPDFSGGNAAKITTAGVRVAVAFASKTELPPKFTVKVTIPDSKDARLYAIYAE